MLFSGWPASWNSESREIFAKTGKDGIVFMGVKGKQTDLVELGFMEARAKLIDVAAFLDRVQRHGQQDDFRVDALREAMACLELQTPDRVARILHHLSDPSSEPIDKAHTQGAAGAVDPAAIR